MKKTIFYSLSASMIVAGMIQTANAQIVSGVSFLKGKWIELAVSECGTYGSGAGGTIVGAPEGYHENNFDGSLSFTNDNGMDGWDVGVPDQCGDFIMPGSPEEGFAIQIGTAGTVYSNVQPWCNGGTPAFPGANITNNNIGGSRRTIWQGTNEELGLAVAQTTYWLNSKQSYITIVDICNIGDDLYDLYYARNSDPDNDQVTAGTFVTTNNARRQYLTDGYSQVMASSSIGSPCYMAYVTGDSRGKVSRGNFAMGEPSDMWNGTGGYIQTSGAVDGDVAIQVSFKMDTLLQGDCGCFTYSTMLTTAGLTNQIDLTNTACTLLGTLTRYGTDMIEEYLDNPSDFVHNSMVAYPNPSNGSFSVNLFEMENADLTVTNAIGDVVYSVNNVSKFVPVVLDVPAGLYFVNAYYGEGKVITKTMVIE